MYLDSMFKVKEVTGDRVRLRNWPRERRVCRLFDTDLNVDEGDIVHLRIENHTPERGWVVDEVYGFHYSDKRDCTVCRNP